MRFSLDIPATLVTASGEKQTTYLQQISIGGCFTEWEENIYVGDEFRLEIELPNKNRLPLQCKAMYRFEDAGIGVRFIDITRFEQKLISKIISQRVEDEGIPMEVDPFRQPSTFISEDDYPQIATRRSQQESMLEEAMSSEV